MKTDAMLIFDDSDAEGTPKPPKLTMVETLACVDDNGAIRCSWCGRFARLSGMNKVQLSIKGGCISVAPHCGCQS